MVDPAYDVTAPWSATASRVASVGAKVHRPAPHERQGGNGVPGRRADRGDCGTR
jgi:hypothetical protein